MNKKLRKAIMLRSRLKNKFNKNPMKKIGIITKNREMFV